jgi:hypothetical protein
LIGQSNPIVSLTAQMRLIFSLVSWWQLASIDLILPARLGQARKVAPGPPVDACPKPGPRYGHEEVTSRSAPFPGKERIAGRFKLDNYSD